MKNIIYWCLLFFIGSTSSCDIVPEEQSKKNFFDIGKFLDNELDELANLSSLEKKVIINDEVNQKILSSFDLGKDLEIFRNTNINLPTLKDKYQVDSTFDDSGKLSLEKYTAIDEDLKTRSVIIHYQEGKVHTILIKNKTSNRLTSLDQELKYNAGQGYSIESKQKIALGDEQILSVEVNY